jgi:hypothetical protein
MSQPDIEIYVKGPTADQIQGWLASHFEPLTITSQSKQRCNFLATWQGIDFEVIVLLKVQDGFTSIWFNHGNLPWADDKSCAQQALLEIESADLQIRCVASGWQEGDAPDQWLHLDKDGERLIFWPE